MHWLLIYTTICILAFTVYLLASLRSKRRSLKKPLKLECKSNVVYSQQEMDIIDPFIIFNGIRLDKSFTIKRNTILDKNYYIISGRVDVLINNILIGQLGNNQITYNALDLLHVNNKIVKKASTDILVCEIPSNSDQFVNIKMLEKTCFEPMLRFFKNHSQIATLETIKTNNFEEYVLRTFNLNNYKVDTIQVQGDINIDDSLYYVVSGSLSINGVLFEQSSVFGYFGIFFNHYKGFKATAEENTVLEYIPYSKLKTRDIDTTLLKNIPYSMLCLTSTVQWKRIPYGNKIFEKGSKCENVYIVDGIAHGCKECILRKEFENDLVAEKTVDVIKIPRNTMEILLKEISGFYETLTNDMFKAPLKHQSKIVLITPAVKNCDVFIKRLKKTLGNNSILLRNTNISEILGKNLFNPAGELAISETLNSLRETYRVVIIYIENEYSRMLQMIHPYCDIIFLVGSEIIQNYFDRKNVEFVKIYETRRSEKNKMFKIKNVLFSGLFSEKDSDGEDSDDENNLQIDPLEETPTDDKAYSKNPKFRRVHHILCPKETNFCPKDFERFSRYLLDERYGLVLGGGGARGFAHIGVIKALEEENVPIDVIGGTSMGAFVGALYAKQLGYVDVYTQSKKISKIGSSLFSFLFDITWPFASLFSGKSFERCLKSIFKKDQIQDFWLEYYCVTTNLKNIEQSVHFNGSAFKYVRSSMAVAGLVPPVFYKDEILCDGAYVNNVPTDVMSSLDVKNIISVRVCRDFDQDVCKYDSKSGLVLLFKKLFLSRPYLSLIETMYRLSFLSSNKRLGLISDQSLLIFPDLGSYNPSDFHKFDEIVACGYQTAKAKIKEWKAEGKIKDFKKKVRRFSI